MTKMVPVEFSNVKAIVMDIEGTTTSISFVKETLFPYVRTHLAEYLNKNWEGESLLADVKLLKEQYNLDKEAEVEGVVPIEDGDKTSLEKNILWQMDLDRKTTALKQLQGHIWADGYASGDLKGHIYEDVADSLKKWSSDGRRLFIYSSGSIDAQKLLFGNTTAGSLLEVINGHYDTTTGPKQESKSYDAIAADIGCPADQIVFLTDIVAEAEAAKTAGIQAVLVEREGNAILSDEARATFTVITSFDQIVMEPCSKRAKRDIEPQKEKVAESMEIEAVKEDKAETNAAEVKTSDEMEVHVEDEATEDPKKSVEEPIVVNNTEEAKKENNAEPMEESKSAEIDEAKPAVAETPAQCEVAETIIKPAEIEEVKVCEPEQAKGAAEEVKISEASDPDETEKVKVRESPDKNPEQAKEEVEPKASETPDNSEEEKVKISEITVDNEEEKVKINETADNSEEKIVTINETSDKELKPEDATKEVEEVKGVENTEEDEVKAVEEKVEAANEEKTEANEIKEEKSAENNETEKETNGQPGPTEAIKNGTVNGVNDDEKPTNGTNSNGAAEIVEDEAVPVKKIADEATVEVAVAAE